MLPIESLTVCSTPMSLIGRGDMVASACPQRRGEHAAFSPGSRDSARVVRPWEWMSREHQMGHGTVQERLGGQRGVRLAYGRDGNALIVGRPP